MFDRAALGFMTVLALVVPAGAQLTVEDIAALRSQGEREGWTFTVDLNPATQYPLEQLCGVKIPPNWRAGARFDLCEPKRDLPETFDWRNVNGENYCTPIRNQGGCGSCWAFALTGSFESAILIKDHVSTDLAEQWLVSCCNLGGCSGEWPGNAANYYLCNGQWHDPWGGQGAIPEAEFPYVAWDAPCNNGPYTHPWCLDSWAFIGPEWGTPTVEQLKQAILDYGPVTVCVYVNSAFQGYSGGVFNGCQNQSINHAVDLVGWDDNQGPAGVWFLRNSWGAGWGESGYMRIQYNCSQIGYNGLYVNYAGQNGIRVAPLEGLNAVGDVGGPFAPTSKQYTVSNVGTYAVDFQVTAVESWTTVTDGAAGTLAPGEQGVVTISINDGAAALPIGMHYGAIAFTNTTDHTGDTSRTVSLDVRPKLIHGWYLDTNPGWTTEGQWAFGPPTGQGGALHGYPDPTNGATGANVFGVNLNGDYSTTVGGPYYLTSGPIDLSSATGTSLWFRRWLNTDYRPWVAATVEVSADGSNWTQVWSNGGASIKERTWTQCNYDIATIADGQPAVYLRWSYAVLRTGAHAYSGWNIDDVEIRGLPTGLHCDLNCDGTVNFLDINPFVLYILDCAAWQAAFPGCPVANGDIDGDGVNACNGYPFDDLNAFVSCIMESGKP